MITIFSQIAQLQDLLMQGQNIFLDTSRNLFGKYSTAEKFGVGKIF